LGKSPLPVPGSVHCPVVSETTPGPNSVNPAKSVVMSSLLISMPFVFSSGTARSLVSR
jgi:hypothetical protein